MNAAAAALNPDMEVDTPGFNLSAETLNDNELQDSPLLNLGPKQKSTAAAPQSRPPTHQRSHSLKRPLTLSPKVDSPTCSVLAADFSSNFHVNGRDFRSNNPKKILLPSMMTDDKENIGDAANTTQKKLFINRKHLRKTASTTTFKSNSLASYHSRSSSSSSIATAPGSGSSSIFHTRSTSVLSDTSTPPKNSKGLSPGSKGSQVASPNTLFRSLTFDSLAVPTPPTAQRVRDQPCFDVSPETEAIINSNRLKKSFSLINPQHNNLERELSSSSASENENEDNSDADEEGLEREFTFGSPLQQKSRSTSRTRIELNGNLRSKLQRATSMIQSTHEIDGSMANKTRRAPPPAHLFKISTNPSLAAVDRAPLSAGASQLTNTINGLNFGNQAGALAEPDFSSNNSVLTQALIQTFYVDDCTLPRIDVDQFHEILTNFKAPDKTQNKYSKFFDDIVVIDCRFEYEFEGGHIDCALNVSSKQELEKLLLSESVITKTPLDHTACSRKLLIFHCEFSSHRGPIMANILRTWDRFLNKEYYPNLYYPDIVILQGGYKKFYEKYNGVHCFPLNYVEMHDPQFKDQCEVGLSKLRRDSKLNLNRKNSLNSISSASSGTWSEFGTLKKSFTSSSVLSFGESSKVSTKRAAGAVTAAAGAALATGAGIFGGLQQSSPDNAGFGGEFGGFGSSMMDLDNLCDDSPIFNRIVPPQTAAKTENDEVDPLSTEPAHTFRLPSLPKRRTLHFRSKTIAAVGYANGNSSANSTPPHFSHILRHPAELQSKFARRFEKHVDTPITKRT